MSSTLAPAVGTIEKVETTPSNFVESIETGIYKSSPSPSGTNFINGHVQENVPSEGAMDRRVKVVFALAAVAGLLSLAGQERVLGISNLQGFAGALAVLAIAAAVAVLHIRDNSRTI